MDKILNYLLLLNSEIEWKDSITFINTGQGNKTVKKLQTRAKAMVSGGIAESSTESR